MNLDKFIYEHETISYLILVPALALIMFFWIILAFLEQGYYWIRGYNWDSGYGGYRHRKTGQRP